MASILDSAKNNNARILKMQLSGSRNVSNTELNKALILSSTQGYTECVECLLAAGVNIEVKDTGQNTPLLLAVQSDKEDVVAVLLDAKCNVDTRGRNKSTPLHMAAKLNHNSCMTLLLRHGANPNARDSDGNTPLILSSKYCNYDAMQQLIQAGCNLDEQNNEGMTALHYSSHKAWGVNILLNAGANPNIDNLDNIPPLIMAASEGFDKVVQSLVKAKCNINATTSVQKTALHILAGKGHWDCITDLILAGADVNMYDDHMHSPMYHAVNNGRYEVVKLLLKANCEHCGPRVPPEACPAHLALSKGLINIVKLFILTGYDRRHLQEGLNQQNLPSNIVNSNDFQHWRQHAHDVMTLKQICRKHIRHQLGRSVYHNLEDLPIPAVMKDFIILKELDDEH